MGVPEIANLSSDEVIYSGSDEYPGRCVTIPPFAKQFTSVSRAVLFTGGHDIIGSGSMGFAGVRLEEGVALGAFSFFNKSCDRLTVYTANTARNLKFRSLGLLNFEAPLLTSFNKTT